MKKKMSLRALPAGRGAVRRKDALKDRLMQAAFYTEKELFRALHTGPSGLNAAAVERSREQFGANVLAKQKHVTVLRRLLEAFLNPFTMVLLALAVVSLVTDVFMAAPEDRNYVTAVIIVVLILFSGILRFVQEGRSSRVADQLLNMIQTTSLIEREGVRTEIPMEEIVVGDLLYLSAGDMLPADVRILTSKDLFVSQSALTGESEPVEKLGNVIYTQKALTEMENLAFMGSNVISGSAKAVVVAVGKDTFLGSISADLSEKPPKTAFEKGIQSVSWLLIRFMLVMVPIVLFINGFTKGDWLQALLFAISVAVGLTPEMLPMIVTTSLAKGAVAMSRKKVVVKNLNAIQNLGSMDILCTDKTGTLTQDQVVLARFLNLNGDTDKRVLRHAFLNSYFQTGLRNLLDVAIISRQQALGADELMGQYTKVDEIPFDFERRRMSVVVQDHTGKTQMVTKGAVEEMLACCTYAEQNGHVVPLTSDVSQHILDMSAELNTRGMRVIAVAQKTNPSPIGQFSISDESEMVLIGFLAFLDPPKDTAQSAVEALLAYGVHAKVLTGDNEKVTRAICQMVGLPTDRILLGNELDEMPDEQLGELAEEISVFAKLSPLQKSRIIRVLRDRGHCVGFMGDGINDASALKTADVGISVDTAVDIAKESSSVILMEKDLMVLERGVLEGRRTYSNMIKYLKMTVSSNFGNVLSVLIASAFLPFLPMASLHLILLNLIYDISCTAISWDRVDPEDLAIPRKWDTSGISRFMFFMGPVSSLFDIATYLGMYFIICPLFTGGALYSAISDPASQELYVSLFQTGWFVESMWSQSLVIHMIRTKKIPFIQSRASLSVTLFSLLGVGIVTLLPFSPLAEGLGLTPLPLVYFAGLLLIIAAYMVLATLMKNLYIRRYHTWL